VEVIPLGHVQDVDILPMFLDIQKVIKVQKLLEQIIPRFFNLKVLVSTILAFLLTVGITYTIQLTDETEIAGIFIVMFLMVNVIYLLFQQPEVFSESDKDRD